MRTALITTAHGRAQHLHRQLDGISRSARLPDTHVIVAIDDPAVSDVVAASGNTAHVVHYEGPPGSLPVASARNIGALAALNEGAELLAFLDVDCIPGRSLLGRYYKRASTSSTATHCCADRSPTCRHREARKATQWRWNQ